MGSVFEAPLRRGKVGVVVVVVVVGSKGYTSKRWTAAVLNVGIHWDQ